MKKIVLRLFLPVIFLSMLTGCFFPGAGSKSRKEDWKPTDYTVEDLMGMALDCNGKLDDVTDDDCTERALKAYNILLGYVESVTDMDYKIYDFYHVDFDTVKSYVVKIIVGDKIDEVENRAEPLSADDTTPIMLTCNEDGSNVASQLEPYLMTRKWEEDIKADIAEKFPEYHLNTWYIQIEHMVPRVRKEKYDDICDYTYFYDDDFYESKYKYYDNEINIIVPPGTDSEKAEEIFEEAKQNLMKYCVTKVYIVCPASQQDYERMLSEEEMTGNLYIYKDDDEVQWIDVFNIIDE